MDREEFLKHVFQNTEGMIEVRPFPGKRGFFEIDDIKGIDAYCKKYTGSDLYFGVGTRDGKGGKKENIIHIPCVWCDGDFKDTPKEKLRENLKNFPYRPSIIVSSGGGVHMYWLLSEPAGRDDIPLIENINRRIAHNLGGDMNACDAARILRLPSTINHKYPAYVRVLQLESFYYDPENFTDNLPDIEQEYNHKTINKPGNNKTIEMLLACDFISWCKNNPEKVPEPLWYSMISNLICIRPGGVSLCHKYSKNYPGYSRKETDSKILHAMDGSAPHTCKYIKSNGFKCTKDCGVKSPASLVLLDQPAKLSGDPENESQQEQRIKIYFD